MVPKIKKLQKGNHGKQEKKPRAGYIPHTLLSHRQSETSQNEPPFLWILILNLHKYIAIMTCAVL